VEQGSYGHRARKATWLYANGIEDLPSLKWGKAKGKFDLLDEGFHSKEDRDRKIKTGICQRLSKKQRLATPILFRDLLLEIIQG
jgi:outer membrane protein assembly factor BamD (BamD/ComL family)